MISDSLKNLPRYNLPMGEQIKAFIDSLDPASFGAPETEIKGRDLFVRCSQYTTKDPAEGKFETHRVYADLQYVVKGAEVMETAPQERLIPLTEYDAKGDYRFYSAAKDISRALVRTGEFAVFFPGEAHRPCCSPDEGPNEVKKLVFKIRMG